MAASSKPLLPSEPAPAPRAAGRPSLTFPAFLVFSTILFGVAARNSWADGARLAYFTVCYVLLLISAVSNKCSDLHPRGSAAGVWAWRAWWISLAGIFAACLLQPYVLGRDAWFGGACGLY